MTDLKRAIKGLGSGEAKDGGEADVTKTKYGFLNSIIKILKFTIIVYIEV